MKGLLSFLLVLGAVAAGSIPSSPDKNDVPDPAASSPKENSTVEALSSKRNSRSFKVPAIFSTIGSFFGGSEEPEIPHLGHQPLWKVHKYHGISLQPVHLPEPEIPSGHPLPPTLHGEPPSIANVPEPVYGHDVIPPVNEYGPPQAPYPPAEPQFTQYSAPAGPYPSAPAGPYPSAPAGPYPSAPEGPYAPASTGPYPPNAPLPEVYNAHLSHDEPRGPPSDFPSNFLDLQNMLPPEIAEHMQQYFSTSEGGSRLAALFGIAQNAQKLKANAAHSLQGLFQRLLGGAGGSSDIALDSGTYTDVPHDYPAPQGILNSLRLFGSGISGSPLPSLPDAPPLPKIPGLKELPHVPGLPHINLPDTSHHIADNTIGKYVSFSIPEHHEEHAPYVIPEEHPVPYHAPEPAPAAPYPAPAPAPAGPYPPPAPAGPYSAPAPEIPSTSYGTPEGPTFSYPQTPGQEYSGQHSQPQPSYQLPSDASPAGSEKREQTQTNESEKKEEVKKMPILPLKTTKMNRIPGSHYRNHRVEAEDRNSDFNDSIEENEMEQ